MLNLGIVSGEIYKVEKCFVKKADTRVYSALCENGIL